MPARVRRRSLLAAAALGVAGRSRAAAPVTLTVAAFPMVDAIVRAALPGWQQRHPGVQVQVISRQYDDHHTAMTTALSTSSLLPDVMALEASYLGRFVHGHGLQDLAAEPWRLDRERERFVPYAMAQAANHRGELVAVPTDIGPGTLLWRTDILARAGVPIESLTADWPSLIDAGRRIKAATGASLLGSAQVFKDILLRSGIGPGEGLFFGDDDRVLVRSERFRQAFALTRELRRAGLDARTKEWTNDWAEGFKRGRVATDLTGAWMVGQLATAVAPATRGLWRAAPLPGGAQVGYGGTYYALPRRADAARKELAWSLVRWLTMERANQLAAFRAQDAFPALLEAHDDPFFDEPLPFLGGQPARRLWREAARRIPPMVTHRQNDFAREVVNTELDNVMDRGKGIEQALADAERLLLRRAQRR